MKKLVFCFMAISSFLLWAEESELFKKVNFSFYTLTGFETKDEGPELSSTIFSGKASFLLSDFRFSTNRDKINFGISIKTDNILRNYPFTIKYGNLSPGGSYSKLGNPLLSPSSSPFSISSTSTNCIIASLPGSSSFSKPETLFVQAGYSNSKKAFQAFKINCFYNPQSTDTIFSTLISFKLPNRIFLSFSATSGNLLYDENTFSSWFTNNDFYYHSGKHNCLSSSLSLNMKNAGFSFSSFFYESPFGVYDGTFKTENFIKFKHTTINLSGLYNPCKQILTSSQKKITDCVQIKTGFIYSSRCETSFPLFIKTGINFFGNFNLSKPEDDFRFSTGIQLTSNLTSFTLTGLINAKILNELNTELYFDNSSVQLTNIWYFKKVTTTLKTSFSINPASDYSYITYTQKYSVSLYFQNMISFSTGFNLTHKNEQVKKMSQNSTIQLGIHKKRINYTYKLSFDWQQAS